MTAIFSLLDLTNEPLLRQRSERLDRASAVDGAAVLRADRF